ncbi:unnamed protein product [Didymodactylos carnosus]|uniref:CCHC-type domain-containing protein n=1 Tax=Didymodactylos carnosus TaxID=1234261 RepID=A0A814IIL0_9BILA|nr:unnamed protein product [Didymodactylos carnosus]CAF3795330.1 unnamed protein product [Didymodactylos carnosus]
MAGATNERSRHVKTEFLQKNGIDSLLNPGKIKLQGQLYNVDEYLLSLYQTNIKLICGRCHKAGHVKKNCQNSAFGICRRCGGDRSNIQQHKECAICYHNCGRQHVSPDFRCPLIADYRNELIEVLRRHPETLPAAVQLFIPTAYREEASRSKSIYNKEARLQLLQQQRIPQQIYDRNDQAALPSLHPSLTTASTTINSANNSNMSEIMKSFSDELQDLKRKHEEAQQLIEMKHQKNLNIMKTAWMILQ